MGGGGKRGLACVAMRVGWRWQVMAQGTTVTNARAPSLVRTRFPALPYLPHRRCAHTPCTTSGRRSHQSSTHRRRRSGRSWQWTRGCTAPAEPPGRCSRHRPGRRPCPPGRAGRTRRRRRRRSGSGPRPTQSRAACMRRLHPKAQRSLGTCGWPMRGGARWGGMGWGGVQWGCARHHGKKTRDLLMVCEARVARISGDWRPDAPRGLRLLPAGGTLGTTPCLVAACLLQDSRPLVRYNVCACTAHVRTHLCRPSPRLR